MSTSERQGEGRTTRPAGSLRVHTGARLTKPKSHPPASSFPPSAVVSFLFSASYLAPWAYRASLKPHQHARKASSTVKGGTAGMCQPRVGLGHTSLPVGHKVGTRQQHIPFLHKVLLTPQLHSLRPAPSLFASQVLIFYF